MSFISDLRNMIGSNTDACNWISCAQQDEIGAGTKFVIAATEINNGFMCGGDGQLFGEWAWFNDLADLYDYLLHLAIPFNLCTLEDQAPSPS